MKIALLGDVHGNDAALRAVLSAAESLGVQRLLVTGDLVGYYFRPAEVLELLQPWPHALVRGNHEEMLRECRSDPEALSRVSASYGPGIAIALQDLEPAQLDHLCGLPHPLALDAGSARVLLSHGAPSEVDRYVYPDSPMEELEPFVSPSIDMVVMGHTHYPMVRRCGTTLMVNPGSVGQPRNGAGGACWALYDTETSQVALRTESYDLAGLVEECRSRHPELPYLADVLLRR